MGNGLNLYLKPDVTPHPLKESQFDPTMGFPSPRVKREMVATEKEMQSAKLALEDRDYCAHKLLEYRSCRADTFPFVYKCAHEKHDYLNCQYEDYILRMKEYERERRLMERKKRVDRMQARGDL